MARLRRTILPNVPAHLVIRGNDRKAVFRSEGDRIYFHRCLRESVERFDVAVHAYVLMTNHVHLLVSEAPGGSLSQAVQMLGRRYVSYFNYLHERTGTLWEGRFHSSLVETERYLFVCHQYIEENPVRAGMVSDPGHFEWSSHERLASGRKDDLVTPHPLYLALGASEPERASRYRALFRSSLEPETLALIRGRLNAGLALGGEDFCEEVETRLGLRVRKGRMGRPPLRTNSEKSALIES